MNKIASTLIILSFFLFIKCDNFTSNFTVEKGDDLLHEVNTTINENPSFENNTNYTTISDTNLTILESKEEEDISLINTEEEEMMDNSTQEWEKLFNEQLEAEDEFNQELVNQAERVDAHDLTHKEESDEEDVGKREWEQKLSSFDPAEMLTFDIAEDEVEMIFDPILEVPSLVKLVFVVNNENTNLDFHIYDPKQKAIVNERGKQHLFYEFNATIPGEYIFALDNKRNSEPVKVTFAIHQGSSTNTHLSQDNLDRLWEKIKIINQEAKKSRFTARLLSKKYDAHYEMTKKHNRNIVMFSLLETALMTLIFFFQLFYIKRLASKINL